MIELMIENISNATSKLYLDVQKSNFLEKGDQTDLGPMYFVNNCILNTLLVD